MGLDMVVMFHNVASDKDTDIELENTDNDTELFTWRKHPDLHGWMHDLYVRKGGINYGSEFGPTFNTEIVVLTMEDIDALEKTVEAGALPETSGFFFGKSTPADKVDDLKFIKLARQEIADGEVIYYTSWW